MAEITSIATQNPLIISPVDTVTTAIDLMATKGFRRLPIVWKEELVGIITASDIMRILQIGDLTLLNKEVHNFMVQNPYIVYRDDQISDAVKIMFENEIGSLPILSPRDGSLSGIVTERDLVRAFVDSIADADLEGFYNPNPPTANYAKTKVIDIIDILLETSSSRVLLTYGKNKLKGIITTKDILTLINNDIIKYGKPKDDILLTPTKEIAITDIMTINLNNTVHEVAQIFLNKGIGGLPIVNEDKTIVGIFTERDLLKLIGIYNLM